MSMQINVERKEWVPGQECITITLGNFRDDTNPNSKLQEMDLNFSIPKAKELYQKLGKSLGN